MSIQNTAISGLLAAQRGLTVTGHNISNVNTPGYSRQRLEVSTRQASFFGNGFVGNGVDISSIVRSHDIYLTNQLRNSITAESEASSYLSLASRMDNMLANEETGLTRSLQNFFNAVQDVSDQPSSIAARQVMISEAESLSSRFQFLDARMSDMSGEIRTRLGNDVRDMNSISDGIGRLNEDIVKALGQSGGQPPNDLMDKRDKLIEDLSKFISVSVVEQSDGSVNLFVGKGQPLVLGKIASQISTNESYRGHFQIFLNSTFNSSDISSEVKGGILGGILKFQTEMLEPARNSLGRLALGFADSFNSQHALGQSLDGDINSPFFNTGVPEVLPLAGAPNNITAQITDTTALSNSDYSLVYNGGNLYTLTRITDGQTTSIDTGGAALFVSAPVDGFTLSITAGAAVNEKYIIRPSINGAGDISVAITNPRKVAAAAALRSSVATSASGVPLNSGNAIVSDVSISSVTGLPMGSAVTLTFDSALNIFNISSPPGGTFAYNPVIDSGGKQFSLATIGNASFSISGNPADGDQFVIENNSYADGDNQNALKLSDLQTSDMMLGGTATYQDVYSQLVGDVGTVTRQIEISNEALASLKSQSLEFRDSVSGVNLEEEAGNMLKYQQAFQAAAKMVGTADRIFQTLLQSIQ